VEDRGGKRRQRRYGHSGSIVGTGRHSGRRVL
jgi:hypothetical protein